MTDDLGVGDVGFTEVESRIPTPNLDNLAKGGVRFSSYYGHSAGTPSLAAFFTGSYAHNVGMANAKMHPGGKNILGV